MGMKYFSWGSQSFRTAIKPSLRKCVDALLFGVAALLICPLGAVAQQTIWPSTAVPATIDNGPDGPLELGVAFKSDTAGSITGMRFYKSSNNTDTHVGHIWSLSGALLGSVTFTGESSSGWQQANFPAPLSITANTVYVASYQSSVGHWSVDWSYFANSGVNNPPLHAVQDATSTPDGVWGTAGAFPTNTNASNYWVDVVFKAKVLAPSVTTQPVNQSVTAGQAATFSVTASGTAPLSYQWKKNGTAISGATSSSYSTPATSATDSGSHFTVTVSNSAGTATSNAATLTVSVPVAQQTIWPSTAVPGTVDSGASSAVELGVSFKSDVAGSITGIRFYKSSTNTGTHVGHLWSSTGALLASVTFTGESASGWQQANFSSPVAIKASTVYVASYQSAIGHFSVDWSYFVSQGANNPPLHALQNGNGAPDGVWGSPGTFPNGSNASNYWVDVAFTSSGAVAPSITTQPVNQTVTSGKAATFSIVAGGTAPLTYQWRKNGTAISGATAASYTTPATTTIDNGEQFTVVVSNSAGTATSNTATLTVNSASTYQLNASPASLSFGNVNTGSSSTLSVTLTNSGNSSVTISGAATSGAGFSDSGVSSGTVIAAGQTATLNVAFAPSAAGSVSGSVSVASNATNSPAVISLAGSGVQQTSASFPVWVMPSLDRVGQTDAPGSTSAISLSGARGEIVDSQVVVQGPLTNVNVSASALSGPNGASIPASSITLYREYYLSVTGTASYGGGSNPPLGSGTYPEPLIPFLDPETGAALCSSSASLKACNASVNSGQNQPYWMDISVPHGASDSPTGVYSGTISVTSDQGNASIPVSLTVWNFELPMQPSELSLWTLWPANSGNTSTTLAQALMRNKVMSWYDTASNSASDISNMGLNRSGLDNYYYIGIQCGGSYSSLPSTSQINSAAANFPSGLALDFYVADELNGCTGDYSPIQTLASNAHAANPPVKLMMTLNAADPNLYGSIDHWVLLDSMQQWPALPFTSGDLWSYTSCNAGYGNTPEWMVDYPPINERIQAGFLNWTEGATGLLYYRADGWTNGNTLASWNNVDTTACGGGLGRPGDGIFLYPPGPIASTESAPGIRLKAIRDGIQDYEYLHMLNGLGQLSFVNSIVLPVATSWTNWTHDPNALVNVRQQLGQQLHLLAP